PPGSLASSGLRTGRLRNVSFHASREGALVLLFNQPHGIGRRWIFRAKIADGEIRDLRHSEAARQRRSIDRDDVAIEEREVGLRLTRMPRGDAIGVHLVVVKV